MVKAVAETLFAKHPTAIYATARALLQVAPDQSEALINAILSTAPDQLKSVVLAVIESDNDSGTATAAALKAIQQRARTVWPWPGSSPLRPPPPRGPARWGALQQ